MLDGLMADPEAALGHRGGNRAKRHALLPHGDHGSDFLLLSLMFDQRSVLTDAVAERHFPAEIAPPPPLILLHIRDPLADAVALSLGKGGRNSEKQLTQAVPGDVTP